MRISEALKYLGGGWVVYTVMASCSSGALDSAPAAGSGGRSAASPVPVANAQEPSAGASACGTCVLPATITTKSAADDPERWEAATVQLPGGMTEGIVLASGPIVISTINAPGGGMLFIQDNAECASDPDRFAAQLWVNGTPFSGRLLVPPGKTLCAYQSADQIPGQPLSWTGYRPYE